MKRFYLLLLLFSILVASAQKNRVKDICAFLGNRSDKNFLGSGNVALVIDSTKAKVLFVQQWKEKGLVDWASGTIKSWSPDRIEMNETIPPVGAKISYEPTSRTIWISRDDVVGMQLIWKNDTRESITVTASFSGTMPGKLHAHEQGNTSFLSSTAQYSDRVDTPVHYSFSSSDAPELVGRENSDYSLKYQFTLQPKQQHSLTLLLGIGIEKTAVATALKRWDNSDGNAVRDDWNSWFDKAIPHFECSNPYFEKLYYYRWWSLYTKMIFAKVGHFYYPSPREGTVMYEGVVSYSGACVSVDELRWMRSPDWAFSTTQEFFAPGNLNDGYLSNHIWDWGIDADESNIDTSGRSVPYQNYAVDAFYGASLVHPEAQNSTLKKLWPQFRSNLASYTSLFDIDSDGLYETYPWSNSAGQEWTARYSYFDPIPEMFRNERGRTYSPDGSRVKEDMALAEKIRNTVVTDPDLNWPKDADELYRIYRTTQDHRLATVDQSTYAYKNFLAASSLAKRLGDSANETLYAKLAEQTKTRIVSQMWNETDHFFYDVKPTINRQAKVKATTGFYVFWARMAEMKHLPMLQHVFNPATFWTKYPLPSLPLDYKKYDQIQQAGWNYWNYATWPRTTCHVVDGVLWAAKNLDASLSVQAGTLFDRYTRMHFPNDNLQIPNIAERYDPHTGSPFLENLDYNHSSWIDLLMQHVAGITPSDSDVLTIDPIDLGWDSFSIKNVRYRNHDVEVEFSKTKGMRVKVDGKVRAKSPVLKKVTIRL
ncbi:MAG: hypothetical protein EOO50_00165 [Flavobacterium sp.]|uniref:MGH1-like glycoside hydrolase domain-containing protein n=1 Tax=Flavobacterium sp. TaxID=239 RepID=UPI0012028B51|nr:trehalase family glycosidase [Flavobacterium sp.]RZJ68629.1 MAG: hypothetical protein EOO50_00165 [Flavobacterium sp.]